jgi:urease accessory protein
MKDALALLSLLQWVSPALPVGAYSYSEGIEALVEMGVIGDRDALQIWLERELNAGSIRLEAAILVRAYRCLDSQDLEKLCYWNQWLSASRETSELRQQNWQMGQSLIKLLTDLTPDAQQFIEKIGLPCNFAIAFALASHVQKIPLDTSLLGYLYSWAANLISAGVRLIPLGQTAGQQIQRQLQPCLIAVAADIPAIADEDLGCCSWGLSLASMTHETQYTRLFRS